jgi:hypothetical protein
MYNCTNYKNRLQTNDRPAPSSDGASHETKDHNSQTCDKVKSGHEPQKGLDTKTDWLTDHQL